MAPKTTEGTNPISTNPQPLGNTSHPAEEINLINLWLSLVNQKKIFFLTLITLICLGLLFALTRPLSYSYTTTIEIGTKGTQMDEEGQAILIQSLDTVTAEVRTAYIDQALREFYNTQEEANIIKIDVDSPENTSLLLLSSQGSLDDEKSHLTVHTRVAELLTKKHNAITQAIRETIHAEQLSITHSLEDLENDALFASTLLEVKNTLKLKQDQLARLKEDKLNLEKQLTRLDSLHKLLSSQYKSAVQNLEIATKNQQLATKGSPDTPLLIMLTSELQQYRTRITALEERLNINLPAQEQEIKQEIANNLRAQENQLTEIQQADYALTKLHIDRTRQTAELKTNFSKLEHDLKAIPTTHAVAAPSRSLKPMPRKRGLILGISIVLALFTALCVALFAAFLASVEEQKTKKA